MEYFDAGTEPSISGEESDVQSGDELVEGLERSPADMLADELGECKISPSAGALESASTSALESASTSALESASTSALESASTASAPRRPVCPGTHRYSEISRNIIGLGSGVKYKSVGGTRLPMPGKFTIVSINNIYDGDTATNVYYARVLACGCSMHEGPIKLRTLGYDAAEVKPAASAPVIDPATSQVIYSSEMLKLIENHIAKLTAGAFKAFIAGKIQIARFSSVEEKFGRLMADIWAVPPARFDFGRLETEPNTDWLECYALPAYCLKTYMVSNGLGYAYTGGTKPAFKDWADIARWSAVYYADNAGMVKLRGKKSRQTINFVDSVIRQGLLAAQ